MAPRDHIPVARVVLFADSFGHPMTESLLSG